MWPLDEVGQLNANLVNQQAGPVCPTAAQLSGLTNTGVCCYCTFLFFPSAAWAYTAVTQLLLTFTSFYEVFSDSIFVNTLVER